MKPKVYKLKKGQLHMVKNAKMFKERFASINGEIQTKISNHPNAKEITTSVEAMAMHFILNNPEQFAKNKFLKDRIKEEINSKSHYINGLDDIIKELFPKEWEKISDHIKYLNSIADTFVKNNCERLELLYKSLYDNVIFNGKDPLEAIKELETFEVK